MRRPRSRAAEMMMVARPQASLVGQGAKGMMQFLRRLFASRPAKDAAEAAMRKRVLKRVERDVEPPTPEQLDQEVIDIYEATTGAGRRIVDEFPPEGAPMTMPSRSPALTEFQRQRNEELLAEYRAAKERMHQRRAQQTLDVTDAERAMLMGETDLASLPVPAREELTQQVEARLSRSIPRDEVAESMDELSEEEMRALFEAITEKPGKK